MVGTLNLSGLKGLNMAGMTAMGTSALQSIKDLGRRRMSIGGYSVSPMLIGGAALLAIGGILLARKTKRRKSMGTTQTAGRTKMQHQVHPVK